MIDIRVLHELYVSDKAPVTDRLKTLEIKKYQEILKTLHNYCLVLSPPHEMKILSLLVKIS